MGDDIVSKNESYDVVADISRIIRTTTTVTEHPLPTGIKRETTTLREEIVLRDLLETDSDERRRNTLLAWGSGVVFLLAMLIVAVAIPNPTPGQLRIFLAILAISAAAFATVITGMLSIRLNIGTRATIGAVGALAVAVLFYLVNPAVL